MLPGVVNHVNSVIKMHHITIEFPRLNLTMLLYCIRRNTFFSKPFPGIPYPDVNLKNLKWLCY